jgi:hypothetical protein
MVARWVTEVTAMVHKHAGPHVQLLNSINSSDPTTTKQHQQQCCSNSSCDMHGSCCCSGCCSDGCCCCRGCNNNSSSTNNSSDGAPQFPQGRVGNCNTIIPITIQVKADAAASSDRTTTAVVKQVSTKVLSHCMRKLCNQYLHAFTATL